MLWLWNFFLERRQFTYVLLGALIVTGTYAAFALPKENTPAIDIPEGIVTAELPGASAADMETLVTDKLEDQISNISTLDTVTSDSSDGVSIITVQFTASADINQSIQDLRDAVSKAVPDLPSDATTPQVAKVDFDKRRVDFVVAGGRGQVGEGSRPRQGWAEGGRAKAAGKLGGAAGGGASQLGGRKSGERAKQSRGRKSGK